MVRHQSFNKAVKEISLTGGGHYLEVLWILFIELAARDREPGTVITVDRTYSPDVTCVLVLVLDPWLLDSRPVLLSRQVRATVRRVITERLPWNDSQIQQRQRPSLATRSLYTAMQQRPAAPPRGGVMTATNNNHNLTAVWTEVYQDTTGDCMWFSCNVTRTAVSWLTTSIYCDQFCRRRDHSVVTDSEPCPQAMLSRTFSNQHALYLLH